MTLLRGEIVLVLRFRRGVMHGRRIPVSLRGALMFLAGQVAGA
jgi:hypothetical protein